MKFAINNIFRRISNRILHATGVQNYKNVYWSRYEPKNFGDWVTPYLFNKMNNREPLFCPTKLGFMATSVFGAGSIFRHIQTSDFAIVWGSGIISLEDNFKKPKEIRAVRGPLTRKRCISQGFECPELYGDPAILLPKFYSPNGGAKQFKIGLIPHFKNYELAKEAFGLNDAISIIDVTQPLEKVIRDIVECESTVSGSLHGIIVSHAYGIPSTWVEFGSPLMGDGTKFHDYFLSLPGYGDFEPIVINSETSYEEMLKISFANDLPDQETLIGPLLDVCPFFNK